MRADTPHKFRGAVGLFGEPNAVTGMAARVGWLSALSMSVKSASATVKEMGNVTLADGSRTSG